MRKYWPDDYGTLERISKRAKRYIREIILFISWVGGVLLFAYFTLLWNIIPGFFATFLGVSLSFLLGGSIRRKEARKAAGHTLSAIWLELKHNEQIIRHIKENFKFPKKDGEYLQPVIRKISNLQTWSSRLEDRSFYAGQQSRSFFELESDKIYNAAQTAYYNLKLTQTMLLTAKLSLLGIASAQKEERNVPKKRIEECMEDHISKCGIEIKTSLRIIRGALDQLTKTLKEKYGVTPAEELRGIKQVKKNDI